MNNTTEEKKRNDKKAKMRVGEHNQVVWLNPLRPQGCVFQGVPTGTSVLWQCYCLEQKEETTVLKFKQSDNKIWDTFIVMIGFQVIFIETECN